MTFQIPIAKNLEPYFNIAEDEAHKSLCVRRQYGAVIAVHAFEENQAWYWSSYNVRVSPCCDGNNCARNRVQTRHGGSVEIGGEIHAETSVLIKSTETVEAHKNSFILVGFEGEIELLGEDVYPCHACAMAIKFAGFKYIYIRNKEKIITPISIKEIINYRIGEWDEVD